MALDERGLAWTAKFSHHIGAPHGEKEMGIRIIVLASFASLMVAVTPARPADGGDALIGLNCSGCHGSDGISAGEYIPSISGLDFRYFMGTMLKFRSGERASTVMGRIARGYDLGELRRISRYFADQPWGGDAPGGTDSGLVRRGKAIHRQSCVECHDDDGRYQDKDIPRLAGQRAGYLLLQMQDYRDGVPAMPQPPKMKEHLQPLNDEDLDALSRFYAAAE
jgi:sulfide dehydrogenase cytochrome subunit